MVWETITNIILILSIILILFFLGLGVYELIKKRSIKKVDPRLTWLPLPLALMTLTYFLFDKVWILNVRPNGSGEPSFPSTHVMVVTTIFFVVTIILPKYIKNKTTRLIIEIIMAIMISLTAVGRVMSGMHWVADVLGAIVFGFLFSEIYYYIVSNKKDKKKAKE